MSTNTRPDGGGLAVTLPSLPGAACAGRWGYFFPVDSDRTEGYRRTRRRVAHAKEICATCPVTAECRDFAVRAGIDAGVWGGLTEDERKNGPRLCRNKLHQMTPANTRADEHGHETCRACRAAAQRRFEAKRSAAA